MNTQQLHCFLCVADKLNFTKAAEELYLSTPTVTHHIQRLEAELNTKLFLRNKKYVRLTEAGMVFYKDAEDIIERFNMAKKHAEKMNHKSHSFINIGCCSNVELEELTHILIEFRKEFPEVYPHIILTNYSRLVNMLKDKQLDIVFGTKDMMNDIVGYTFKTIKKISSYAIASNLDPLSSKNLISFDDLQTSCLITLHPKMVPFKYGNKIQQQIQIHSQNQLDIVCENDQASISMVVAGYGIAILPEFCIPKETTSVPITKINLIEREETEYGIVYQSKDRSEPINRFSKLCIR